MKQVLYKQVCSKRSTINQIYYVNDPEFDKMHNKLSDMTTNYFLCCSNVKNNKFLSIKQIKLTIKKRKKNKRKKTS